MGVRFVLGRAGAGKTRKCLDEIHAALRSSDPGRLLFIVPEQATFQMERTLALGADCGGYWRAEVLSFSRLARRVLDDLGCAPEELNSYARAMGSAPTYNDSSKHPTLDVPVYRGYFFRIRRPNRRSASTWWFG